MARQSQKLTAARVKNHTKPGLLSDGAGLYLNTTKTGTKSWIYRYKRPDAKTPTDMGLGAYPVVSLQMARDKALECARQRANDIDPLEMRRTSQAIRKNTSTGTVTIKQRLMSRDKHQVAIGETLEQLLPGVVTVTANCFALAAAKHIATQSAGWSDTSHKQWIQTVRDYCQPLLLMPVANIDTPAVRQCLDPIWNSKPETASRIRGRIENVLDVAKVDGLRKGENPARWKNNLSTVYQRKAKLAAVEHFNAIPYAEVSAFYRLVQDRNCTAATALQFLMLTAARTGEVCGADWSEFDLDNRLWTIPGNRMKAGKAHRVPLSQAALDILLQIGPSVGPVFTYQGKPLSRAAMRALLKRMGREDVTPHGMRSTFRDWALEATDHDFVTCEMALAHAVGDAATQAYMRGDGLEKRRKLMDDWAQWVTLPSNVVPLAQSAG